MASLTNKLIAQVAFKAAGDIFHHLMCYNPRHLINATPDKIQDCKMHQGDFGVNGSVIEWSYTVGKLDSHLTHLISSIYIYGTVQSKTNRCYV